MNEGTYRLIKAVCLIIGTLAFSYYMYYSALAERFVIKDGSWAIIDKVEQTVYEPKMASK